MSLNKELSPRHSRSVHQPSLFRCSPEEFVAELLISIEEMNTWRHRGWLSFDPNTMIEYDQKERVEIEFIKGLARSGLSHAMIDRILTGLQKPYCYEPSTTFFSFVEHRWISLPVEPDPSAVTEEYIEELIRAKEVDTLRELQRKISEAVEEFEQTESGKPTKRTFRIVLDCMDRLATHFLSETDFLKSVEKAQACVTAHGGTIHRVERHPELGEARRFELTTSFEEVSSRAQAERIRNIIDKEIECQHGVYLEE